ncbi:MAG: SGNH/GDSL hydrolase family protein [Ginsengibacter sp.]
MEVLSIFLIIIGVSSFIVISILAIYTYKRFTLIDDIPFYQVADCENSVLTIGIIGDSWATLNRLDNLLHQELLNNGYENKIISKGQSGAKTRLIYQNLFKDKTDKNSCKSVIENNPDYCVLLGGTNDSIGQMGSSYYSFHIIKIIKFLLHYDIVPIVLSLPRIGVRETNKTMNILQQGRNRISVIFNNHNQFENVDSYRKVLVQRLRAEQLEDKILLIDFDKVCDKYEKGSELYKNPIHLSNIGNKKLAGLIANELAKHLKDHTVAIH